MSCRDTRLQQVHCVDRLRSSSSRKVQQFQHRKLLPASEVNSLNPKSLSGVGCEPHESLIGQVYQVLGNHGQKHVLRLVLSTVYTLIGTAVAQMVVQCSF